MHRAVTSVVVGAASIAALQLGLGGPVLSPVQPGASSVVSSATTGQSAATQTGGAGTSTSDGVASTQNQNQNQNHNDAGGRGDGGRGGNGGGGGGRR